MCVSRALTTSFEMRSRTRSGQQKLEDGIEDVTGAYVVSREPVSAMQLQVIIKRVVAGALEVPNEVNDDAIREFCMDVSLLEKTKFRGEHEYVEHMIDSEARKWLTDYLTSRQWRVSPTSCHPCVSYSCLGVSLSGVGPQDIRVDNASRDRVAKPAQVSTEQPRASDPGSTTEQAQLQAEGCSGVVQPTVRELFSRVTVSRTDRTTTAPATATPVVTASVVDSRVQCSDALQDLISKIKPHTDDWPNESLTERFHDRVVQLHNAVRPAHICFTFAGFSGLRSWDL